MRGEPEFEARLWRASSRVWVAVAVAAFLFTAMTLARRPNVKRQ